MGPHRTGRISERRARAGSVLDPEGTYRLPWPLLTSSKLVRGMFPGSGHYRISLWDELKELKEQHWWLSLLRKPVHVAYGQARTAHQLQEVRTGYGNGSFLVGTAFRDVFRAELQIHCCLLVSICAAVCSWLLGRQLWGSQKSCPPLQPHLRDHFSPLITLQSQWSSLGSWINHFLGFTSGVLQRRFFLPGILSFAVFWLANPCLSFKFQHKNHFPREATPAHLLDLHCP